MKTKLSILALAAVLFAGSVHAGVYVPIVIDGDFSDWAGVPVAYANENGVNNPTGVDYQNVYLANDSSYLYIRFTLQASADPLAGNSYIWIDNDNNASTGFHPFGNPNFGSSLMIINSVAYQQAEGTWNEGTLTSADVAYGASSIPGTDFEFRISLATTGVSGAFDGVPLLNNSTLKIQFASETGTGDSLPAWDNYGNLSYTIAVPEPTTAAFLGFGLLVSAGWLWKRRRNLPGQSVGE